MKPQNKLLLILSLLSLSALSIQLTVTENYFQYLEIEQIEDSYYSEGSIDIPIKLAQVKSVFFKNSSSLLNYNPPSGVVLTTSTLSSSGQSFIKRSDKRIYELTANTEFDYMPTIHGNHLTKYLVYIHLEIDPRVWDEDSTDTNYGSQYKYLIAYTDCAEKAKMAHDDLVSTYDPIASSIWTPAGVIEPKEILPFKSYVKAVYNLPYPFVRRGSFSSAYSQVYIDELILHYDDDTNSMNFKVIEDNNVNSLASMLTGLDSCTEDTDEYTETEMNEYDAKILIHAAALKDPDHCTNVNTSDSLEETSDSFLCSNTPERYVDNSDYTDDVDQVMVIKPCRMTADVITVDITGSDSGDYLNGAFYLAEATVPVPESESG